MKSTVKILMLGDVIAQPGLRALFARLKPLVARLQADLVVANGENASGGVGLTAEDAATMFSSGVDVITSGNHIWEKKDYDKLLDANPAILRPANYPKAGIGGKPSPGQGAYTLERHGVSFTVVNLQGRESMFPIDCPFRVGRELVRKRQGDVVIVDFHAESVEEKEALAYWLDGEVAVIAGTHTHVQTADERILPGGTGYISDLGMTGPAASVIGFNTEICLKRSMTQMPLKMEVAESEAGIQGALFTVDLASRKAIAVERIQA